MTTIQANWTASGRVARYPLQLKQDLTALHRALEVSTAKAPAKVIATILQLFRGTDNQSVENFVDEAIAARLKKASPRAPRAAQTFTPEHARKVADQLTSAADDRHKFDFLLGQLKAHCRAAELNMIARLYTGYDTGRTKKDDIISAIRHWQREGEMNRDRRAAQAKSGL